jgi:hypothetical protein
MAGWLSGGRTRTHAERQAALPVGDCSPAGQSSRVPYEALHGSLRGQVAIRNIRTPVRMSAE